MTLSDPTNTLGGGVALWGTEIVTTLEATAGANVRPEIVYNHGPRYATVTYTRSSIELDLPSTSQINLCIPQYMPF